MSLHNRLWRLARGLGRRVSEDVRTRGRRAPTQEVLSDRRSAQLDAAAEAAARAEVELIQPRLPPPVSVTEFPGTSADLRDLTAAETPVGSRPDTLLPPPADGALGGNPALAPYYATLGLPADAGFDRVERAYHELKEQCRPANTDDPLEQARARQRDALLDEAYLALRKALVAERRL